MKITKPKRKTTGAFTLIEIVLVLIIIGLLVAGVLSQINRGGVLDIAKDNKAKGDIVSLSNSILLYYAKTGKYPTQEEGLQALVDNKILNSLVNDPFSTNNKTYQYKIPGERSGDSFDIYSLGPDGVESADDIGNWKIAEE